jgi:hypothetical protein
MASIPTNLLWKKGSLIPLWKTFVVEVRAVIEAADGAERATPAMEQAGSLRSNPVRPTPVAWFKKFG